MKFNFDYILTGVDTLPLLDTDGNELHAAKTAARLILQYPEPGADTMMKFDWAQQLYKTGTIDLDKAGQGQFKKMFETMPNIYLSVRGRLIETLEKRQDELKPE